MVQGLSLSSENECTEDETEYWNSREFPPRLATLLFLLLQCSDGGSCVSCSPGVWRAPIKAPEYFLR